MNGTHTMHTLDFSHSGSSQPDSAESNSEGQGQHSGQIWNTQTQNSILDAIARAYQADGVSSVSEAFESAILHSDPGYHAVIVQDSGTLQGVGITDGHSAEMFVLPEQRHQGIGTALAEYFANQGIELWSHGDMPEAQHIADILGLRSTRELWKMQAPLTSVLNSSSTGVTQQLHQDIEILDYPHAVKKLGEDALHAQWLDVNNKAFDWHPEQGGWSTENLDSLVENQWFNPDGVFFALEGSGTDKHVLGFHVTKQESGESAQDCSADEHNARMGEIYILGVAPDAQGRGISALLTQAGVEYLDTQGVNTLELYVESDNTRAVGLYEKLGFIPVEKHRVYSQKTAGEEDKNNDSGDSKR